MLNKILLITLSVIINSSFAEVPTTLCVTQDATFHSKTNRIMLETKTDQLWIANSIQEKPLLKGCYTLKKAHSSINFISTSKSVITSEYYKIIDERNSAIFLLENRKS
jgi:hypothetical protein